MMTTNRKNGGSSCTQKYDKEGRGNPALFVVGNTEGKMEGRREDGMQKTEGKTEDRRLSSDESSL